MPATPKRGEVWSADLGQGDPNFVIILQSEAAEVLGTTVVVPLRDGTAGAELATNVFLPSGEVNLARASVAMCPLLRAIPVKRLGARHGNLSREKLAEIEQRVAFLLGLPG
jgi:mRNA-degrading endonuclease toxin of MazEF toxin-antitoxin module